MPVKERRTFVIGVGTTTFMKPRGKVDYPEMAVEATTKALIDAGITYDEVESAYAGWVYGDSTSGQRALYAMGMTQIPIINVNNNCSTGSTAFFMARQQVALEAAECSLAVGFEKMQPGSLSTIFKDRANPLDKMCDLMFDVAGKDTGPLAAQLFGGGAQEYCERYGSTWEHVGAISAKNHSHSVNNPCRHSSRVMGDKKITANVTRAMCCPTSDGGAACIVASEDFVKKHDLENQAIEIVGQSMTTDSPELYSGSRIELTGADMTRRAASEAYKQAGVTAQQMGVVELHDCFAANELLLYDALQFTAPGKAHELVEQKNNTYGGRHVINPSGGLESKGHPLGATGLGVVFYLTCQLRGIAGPMQAEQSKPGVAEAQGKVAYALGHNLGLGGSCVVTIFRRPDFFKAGGIDGADVDTVKSRQMSNKYADVQL
ncbi:hypothetical protein RQP46_009475 [Phenoliferia psychrophenolica]